MNEEKPQNRKRLYNAWHDCCDEAGSPSYVASSLKEAKQMARTYEGFEYCDNPFTALRIKWTRKNVDHLSFGEVDLEEGLKNDIYSYAWGIDCEICKTETDENNKAFFQDGKIICQECDG